MEDQGLGISYQALDILMPMHAHIGRDGIIRHAGPTLKRIYGSDLAGLSHQAVFERRQRQDLADMRASLRRGEAKLRLRLRNADRTQLIGALVILPEEQGLLANLSFGISTVEAVARFGLAGSDFSPTDLTVEMLYLMEAKSAAIAASRKMNEKLHGARIMAEEEALTDTLTGLNNRRAMDQRLARLIGRGRSFTLIHLDLDYFKTVNDTFGHAAGDAVLKQVARVLLEETREEDLVARVGGDEFVLILEDLIDPSRLGAVARRIIRRLEDPVCFEGKPCRISASIGMVSSTTYQAPQAAQVLQDADMALYASKGAGRARYATFTTAGIDVSTSIERPI